MTAAASIVHSADQRRPDDPLRDDRRRRHPRAGRRRPDAAPPRPDRPIERPDDRRSPSSAIPARGSGSSSPSRRDPASGIVGGCSSVSASRRSRRSTCSRSPCHGARRSSPSTPAPRHRSSTAGARSPARARDRNRCAGSSPGVGAMSDHVRRPSRRRSTSPPPSPWPLYSFVAALGFARVFGDWQFVGDVVVVVLVGHGAVAAVLRRRVRSRRARGDHAPSALGWTIAWLAYPATFAAIFPTRETWDIAFADLSLVRDQFQTAVAPVEYIGGWALLATIGTAFVVLHVGHVRLLRPRPRRGARARRRAVRLRRRARRRPPPGRP